MQTSMQNPMETSMQPSMQQNQMQQNQMQQNQMQQPSMQNPMQQNQMQQPSILNTQNKLQESSKPLEKQIEKQVQRQVEKQVERQVANQISDIGYDANYVRYQQDGQQAEANQISLDTQKFRMEIGNPNVVGPFINTGLKYYDDIYTESTGAPGPKDAMISELKYGDYNYIGPINRGMINKEYTFISPTNWFPVPPHPPVCVTNKSCTTCPVQMSDGGRDGRDYMNWASWDDFDKARRFTGDMNINTKYIKEVLNNPGDY